MPSPLECSGRDSLFRWVVVEAIPVKRIVVETVTSRKFIGYCLSSIDPEYIVNSP
jgi:hypothetical protein